MYRCPELHTHVAAAFTVSSIQMFPLLFVSNNRIELERETAVARRVDFELGVDGLVRIAEKWGLVLIRNIS